MSGLELKLNETIFRVRCSRVEYFGFRVSVVGIGYIYMCNSAIYIYVWLNLYTVC